MQGQLGMFGLPFSGLTRSTWSISQRRPDVVRSAPVLPHQGWDPPSWRMAGRHRRKADRIAPSAPLQVDGGVLMRCPMAITDQGIRTVHGESPQCEVHLHGTIIRRAQRDLKVDQPPHRLYCLPAMSRIFKIQILFGPMLVPPKAVYVASKNKAKVRAAQEAVRLSFPGTDQIVVMGQSQTSRIKTMYSEHERHKDVSADCGGCDSRCL